MNITLTPEQTQLIHQKLQSDRYNSVEEIITQALQLLNDWDDQDITQDPTWIAETRSKIDAAVTSLATHGGTDGETAVQQLLDKFRKAREAQQ